MSLKEAKMNFKGIITSAIVIVLAMLVLCACGIQQNSSANVPEDNSLEAVTAWDVSESKPDDIKEAFDIEEAADIEEISDIDEVVDIEAPISDDGQSYENSSASNEGFSEDNDLISDSAVGEKYKFRNQKLLDSHYQKHGIEMGFDSPEEYEKAASKVAENPESLHKTEKEDGDDVFYLESTNEFVVVSTDGYIRTYFLPDKGKDYFERQ